MRVGAKTATAVALLVASTLVVWNSGRLRSDYLAQLDVWVTLVAGSLAVVVGTTVFLYWRLWERSKVNFAVFPGSRALIKRGGQRPFELPPLAQLAIYVVVFLWVALIPLNNRAIAQLRDFPRKISQSQAQFCPEAPPDESFDDPTMQGCRLVIRAYELGYVKSLGSCGPQQDEQHKQVCRLRQADEPYLHYAWRLLARTGRAVADGTSASRMRAMTDRFARQWEYAGVLFWAQYDSITGAPRASHHLFTNLPDPSGDSVRERAGGFLNPGRCLQRYASMPHLVDSADSQVGASLTLEHVFGQLLFNPAYRPVAGYCREYAIHWGAPDDACARVSQDPDGFLDERDALDSVVGALGRRRRARVARGLTGTYRDVAATRDADLDEPARVVSFQCLIVDPAAEPSGQDVVERALAVAGHNFRSREHRIRPVAPGPRGQFELSKQLASLLAPGFGYGRLVSHESLASDDATTQTARLLREPDYLLTKLEFLRDADLFLGHDWINARPDLLEVYPYHLHLENFIEVFRDHYLRARGRL